MRTGTLIEALETCEIADFDLDGVFYPITQDILETYALGVARAARELIPHLSEERAVELAWDSWHKYRYSIQIFVEKYGVDLNEMHQRYHKYCDTGILAIDDRLPSLFETFPLHRILQTHGSRDWACRVLEHEKVRSFFPDRHIYALEDFGFNRKSDSTVSFDLVLKREGVAPEKAIMIDDFERNLFQAKNLGMTTVLVTNGKPFRPAPHIDFVVTSLREFLEIASGVTRQPDAGFRADYARKIGPANLSGYGR